MSPKPIPLTIRTSPHLKKKLTVPQIMAHVVIALLPICAWSVWQFGLSALALLIVTTLSCIATEAFFTSISGKSSHEREMPLTLNLENQPRAWYSGISIKNSTLSDYSVVITGLLLALTLPPGFPLWMAAVAGFVAVALGKMLFGGLGQNPFNPALIGRAFVQAAFPVSITTWTPGFLPERFTSFIPSSLALPFMTPADSSDWIASQVDAWSGATPLSLFKSEQVVTSTTDLLFGMSAGSAGETSALLILLGGAFLVARGIMGWKIPVAVMLGTVLTALPFWLFNAEAYPSPLFMLFSGGIMLATVFMATDMVGAPLTPTGIWIFGLFIGFLTVIIRLFGGLPEGAMYAVLLANALAPIIDSYTQPRVFGTGLKQNTGENA